MDVERLLLSKVLAERDMTSVVDAGITATFFLDPRSRQVFQTMVRHKQDYGEVPTVRVMKKDFPDYPFLRADEPLPYLIEEMRKEHALSLYEAALSDAVDAYDDADEHNVQKILHHVLGQVSLDLPTTRDTDITQTGEERLERYRRLTELDGGLRGIPSGFDTIDKATQGFQRQQLVTFVGPPKAGKSTMMLLAAHYAHKEGFSPLVVGFEMSNEEQEERLDAIAAKISHHRLRNGSLRPEEVERLRRSVHGMEAMKSFVLSNDTQSTTTLTGIAAKVERYKPDLLIVDGVYMMDDEEGEPKGSPQALTNITRGFKRLAQSLDIPIIITTQVLTWKMDRRRGITDNSIGYSSSFAQDSDVILGVEKTDDPTINKVKVVIARNCPPMQTHVQWDWETGEFAELDQNPFEDAAEGYEATY